MGSDLKAVPVAKAVIFAFALAAILFELNGCGMSNNTPAPAASPVTSFAFVSNSATGAVSAFAIHSSGALTPVAGSPFASGAGAEMMALDSVHNFLFVSNQSTNTLSVFAADTSSGKLTAAPGSPFATEATPHGVAVDPFGKFVYVAGEGGGISAFAINGTTGFLTPIAGSPFLGLTSAFGVVISPAGDSLYVNNLNSNTVSAFHVDSVTGALTLISGSPFLSANTASGFATPIGLATDGKQLFISDHMAETIVPFTINAGGDITAPAALPTPAASCTTSCHNNPLRMAVHPQDKFLYATNVQAGTLSTFSIGSGSLASIAEVPTGQHPFGVALTPAGNFLYVVNKVDSTISAFSVDATGKPAPLPGSLFSDSSLQAPTDILIVPMR
jgi:DNA-binding beta-propeller fold protein YncE